jgi:hypothetical protein
VKTKTALAKEAFNKRKEFLTKRGLRRTLKKRMVKVLVWPVVLYGCQTWTLQESRKKRVGGARNVIVTKSEKI